MMKFPCNVFEDHLADREPGVHEFMTNFHQDEWRERRWEMEGGNDMDWDLDWDIDWDPLNWFGDDEHHWEEDCKEDDYECHDRVREARGDREHCKEDDYECHMRNDEHYMHEEEWGGDHEDDWWGNLWNDWFGWIWGDDEHHMEDCKQDDYECHMRQ
jgi:hypothetical protein